MIQVTAFPHSVRTSRSRPLLCRRVQLAPEVVIEFVLGAHLRELIDSKLQILFCVSRRDLRPDSRATLRHNREIKSDHIKSETQKAIGHFLGKLGISNHDGDDRMCPETNSQPLLCEPVAEKPRILFQHVSKLCGP